jgi:AraC-like DNA-binding protein
MTTPIVNLPEVATSLVFRTTADRRSDLIVVGPRTRGTYHPGKPLPICVTLRLRPGRSRRLLGVPIAELVDRATPIEDLWGTAGRALAETLAGAGDRAAVLSRLTAALDDRPAGEGAPVVAAAARALSPAGGRPERLATIAARLGVSERHLRTVFGREVGLSPKRYARIARLRHVLARAGRRDWARLAGEAGYFDQAHMISDFRALMGVTPGAYVAGRLPAPAACTELQRR